MEKQLEWMRMCILTAGLLALSIEDVKKRELHSLPILLTAVGGLVLALLAGTWRQGSFWAGFLPGAVVLGLAWMTKEGIGYGDGLVIISMGCFYPAYALAAVVFTAFTAAGVAALVLLLFLRKNKKTQLPFVPFLLGAHGLWWYWMYAGG